MRVVVNVLMIVMGVATCYPPTPPPPLSGALERGCSTVCSPNAGVMFLSLCGRGSLLSLSLSRHPPPPPHPSPHTPLISSVRLQANDSLTLWIPASSFGKCSTDFAGKQQQLNAVIRHRFLTNFRFCRRGHLVSSYPTGQLNDRCGLPFVKMGFFFYFLSHNSHCFCWILNVWQSQKVLRQMKNRSKVDV